MKLLSFAPNPAQDSLLTSTLISSIAAALVWENVNKVAGTNAHAVNADRFRCFTPNALPNSYLRPAPKQSVGVRRQAYQRIGIRAGCSQALDGAVEFEKLRPLRIVANQALNPEHAREPLPVRDFVHPMARCRGVHDHVAGRQFCALAAEVALDDEFAAAVVLRRGQEQGRRQVRAQLLVGAGDHAHCPVHMRAKMHALAVAIEHRRIHLVGQNRTDEQRTALQLRENKIAQLASHRAGFFELAVVLPLRALESRGDAPVHPWRRLTIERGANRRQLFLVQQFRYADEHRQELAGVKRFAFRSAASFCSARGAPARAISSATARRTAAVPPAAARSNQAAASSKRPALSSILAQLYWPRKYPASAERRYQSAAASRFRGVPQPSSKHRPTKLMAHSCCCSAAFE